MNTNTLPQIAIDKGCSTILNGLTAYLTTNIIVGKAFVLLDFEKVHTFIPGSILVTEQTSPECTAAIENATAVLTQRGGILCHAAIVCRDMQIPCIVGIKNLLSYVETGMEIIIDTQTGSIYFNNKK